MVTRTMVNSLISLDATVSTSPPPCVPVAAANRGREAAGERFHAQPGGGARELQGPGQPVEGAAGLHFPGAPHHQARVSCYHVLYVPHINIWRGSNGPWSGSISRQKSFYRRESGGKWWIQSVAMKLVIYPYIYTDTCTCINVACKVINLMVTSSHGTHLYPFICMGSVSTIEL